MKLNQPIDIVMRNIFNKKFAWFGGVGSRSKPFQIYQFFNINPKTIEDEILVFYFF